MKYIDYLSLAIAGEGGGGGGGVTPTGDLAITENGTFNVYNYATATVSGIPAQDSLEITANGDYDVADYKNATVNVSTTEPTGTLSITENGTYEVTDYQYAEVAVEGGGSSTDETFIARMEGTLTEIPEETAAKITKVANRGLAFSTELTTVSLPNVTEIEAAAFSNCTQMTAVSLPKITDLPESAFIECSKLQTEDWSQITGTINTTAFYGCTSLKNVIAPNVTTLNGYDIFNTCTLGTVDLSGVTEITGAGYSKYPFYYATITLLKLNALKTVPAYALGVSGTVKKIELQSVETIEANATYKAVLSNVSFFIQCDTSGNQGTTVATLSGTFNSTPAAIYVPDDLVDSYKEATNWSKYADIIKGVSEYSA